MCFQLRVFADEPGRASDEQWRTVTTRARTASLPRCSLLLSQRVADILKRHRPAAIHLSGRSRPSRTWTEPFVCVHVWASVKFWSGFSRGSTLAEGDVRGSVCAASRFTFLCFELLYVPAC